MIDEVYNQKILAFAADIPRLKRLADAAAVHGATIAADDALLDEVTALVEWPERAPEALPPETLHVRLAMWDNHRLARVTGPARWAQILESVSSLVSKDFIKECSLINTKLNIC